MQGRKARGTRSEEGRGWKEQVGGEVGEGGGRKNERRGGKDEGVVKSE